MEHIELVTISCGILNNLIINDNSTDNLLIHPTNSLLSSTEIVFLDIRLKSQCLQSMTI